MSIYEQLLDHIQSLQIIDTHEHLPASEDRRPKDTDVLSEWLIHYFSCDLVSAGLPAEALAFARDSRQPLAKRWDAVERYWDAARSTGYGRALDLSAYGVYGIDGVSRKTIGPLNEAFVAAREKGGHYQRVLKDKCRIAISVLDALEPLGPNLECDRRFFAPVVRVGEFLCPGQRADIAGTGKRLGAPVHGLADWEEAQRVWLDRVVQQGAVALKVPFAYERELRFVKTDRIDAERQFNALFRDEFVLGRKIGREFQDYMMHALLRLADERGLLMQVHTGQQEGNGNIIANANPAHLTNLFMEYPNVRWAVMHMGYPYTAEMGSIAKTFANVFIDMCWGHIISPEAARRALVEWLDAVPANKICAFGGDYCFVDGVYGHQLLARQNVAAALAQKVADGSFGLERARQIAQWVFVDNPRRIFALG